MARLRPVDLNLRAISPGGDLWSAGVEGPPRLCLSGPEFLEGSEFLAWKGGRYCRQRPGLRGPTELLSWLFPTASLTNSAPPQFHPLALLPVLQKWLTLT